ncbi:MAG: DUF3097 family protein [Acidimicrobiales bacterium]
MAAIVRVDRGRCEHLLTELALGWSPDGPNTVLPGERDRCALRHRVGQALACGDDHRLATSAPRDDRPRRPHGVAPPPGRRPPVLAATGAGPRGLRQRDRRCAGGVRPAPARAARPARQGPRRALRRRLGAARSAARACRWPCGPPHRWLDRPGSRRRARSTSAPCPPAWRASRLWVEGIHDAELIEKVWGDDLRVEGVVVEQLEGPTTSPSGCGASVRDRAPPGHPPRPSRRGSKETRIAAEIRDPNVLVAGHPFVDVWQAVKPAVLGIDRWPEIPRGQPWKEGVIAALGSTATPGEFWRTLLGKVTSWTDLETPMLGAVESLIDFVAPPEG